MLLMVSPMQGAIAVPRTQRTLHPIRPGEIGDAFLEGKFVTAIGHGSYRDCRRAGAEALERFTILPCQACLRQPQSQPQGSGKTVRVCPHPVALDHPPLSRGATGAARPEAPITIVSTLSLASGFERKNPVALIRAFKMAFSDRRDDLL